MFIFKCMYMVMFKSLDIPSVIKSELSGSLLLLLNVHWDVQKAKMKCTHVGKRNTNGFGPHDMDPTTSSVLKLESKPQDTTISFQTISLPMTLMSLHRKLYQGSGRLVIHNHVYINIYKHIVNMYKYIKFRPIISKIHTAQPWPNSQGKIYNRHCVS